MARHIFAGPETFEPRRVGLLKRLVRADRQPLAELRSRQQKFDLVLIVLELKRIAVTHFRHHHAAFTVNRGGREIELAGGFPHQHQRGIEQRRIVARQIQLVSGALIIGRGIGVGTEGQPLTLEQFDHVAFGHMSAAVEGHVLDIVGIAALIVVLVERACANFHPDQRGALGIGIAADNITHAVRQHAEAVTRIDRHVALLERPSGLGGRGAGDSIGVRGAGGEGESRNAEGEQGLG